jgi:tryptophan synthase alpha chain
MSERLKQRFTSLKERNQTAFIPFIMAGDPNSETSMELLKALPDAGADIIEIGMPFSDPMADGPVIEAAGNRALKAGMTLQKTFAMVKEFRESDKETPIILMGYSNPPYQMGWDIFCKTAKEAGVDGIILVDLPPEEEGEATGYLAAQEIDLIRLVTPTADTARREKILTSASGFVYYVSVAGITGDKSAQQQDLAKATSALRAQTNLPLAIGFGIKTTAQAAEAAQSADAVVIGSAIVKILDEQGQKAALTLVSELAVATHSAG